MYYKMPKFDIYLLWGKDHNGNILRYYGSTTNFIKRKYNHKKYYEYWVKEGRPNSKKYSSVYILDNGDWRMDKIDEVIGELWEAKKKESEYIRNNECVNVRIENRTKKEYKDDHKEKITEYHKQYRADNKDKLAEQKKQYHINNKDKLAEYQKQYHINNKDKLVEQKKQYRADNKDKLAEQQKQYRADNKDKLAEYHKQYRADNKQALLEKKKEKIICECGTESTKSDISRHRKTKKHINFISNNELNV